MPMERSRASRRPPSKTDRRPSHHQQKRRARGGARATSARSAGDPSACTACRPVVASSAARARRRRASCARSAKITSSAARATTRVYSRTTPRTSSPRWATGPTTTGIAGAITRTAARVGPTPRRTPTASTAAEARGAEASGFLHRGWSGHPLRVPSSLFVDGGVVLPASPADGWIKSRATPVAPFHSIFLSHEQVRTKKILPAASAHYSPSSVEDPPPRRSVGPRPRRRPPRRRLPRR
mmetsp:Transcript_6335/g.26590  ORF Transcript_6335/g.26590 Transcript_6335/m.26590 type:complete len:239 (-) Transcript_6335:4031-4747(-)